MALTIQLINFLPWELSWKSLDTSRELEMVIDLCLNLMTSKLLVGLWRDTSGIKTFRAPKRRRKKLGGIQLYLQSSQTSVKTKSVKWTTFRLIRFTKHKTWTFALISIYRIWFKCIPTHAYTMSHKLSYGSHRL